MSDDKRYVWNHVGRQKLVKKLEDFSTDMALPQMVRLYCDFAAMEIESLQEKSNMFRAKYEETKRMLGEVGIPVVDKKGGEE